jgi:hypothetical protein
VEKLCKEHDCHKRQAPPVHGPRGKVTPEYLYRVDNTDGRRYVAQLPPDEPEVSALPSVIRSICAQLGLDLHNTDFGVLSELSSIDDDE